MFAKGSLSDVRHNDSMYQRGNISVSICTEHNDGNEQPECFQQQHRVDQEDYADTR